MERLQMYFMGAPQIRWPQEIFETYPIPASARDFLTSVGLAESFEWPPLEFGIYDSDSSKLVIGEFSHQPIVVDATTGMVWVETEQPSHRFYSTALWSCSHAFSNSFSSFSTCPMTKHP